MTRSREEIVADVEALLLELEDLKEGEDEGWVLQDWVVVERWQRLNEERQVRSAFTLEPREGKEADIFLLKAYLREGLEELGVYSSVD